MSGVARVSVKDIEVHFEGGHRLADELSVCDAPVRRRRRLVPCRTGAANLPAAVCLRHTQAIHVPLTRVAGLGSCATRQPGNQAQALPTGHWVMPHKPEAFLACVAEWLRASDDPR